MKKIITCFVLAVLTGCSPYTMPSAMVAKPSPVVSAIPIVKPSATATANKDIKPSTVIVPKDGVANTKQGDTPGTVTPPLPVVEENSGNSSTSTPTVKTREQVIADYNAANPDAQIPFNPDTKVIDLRNLEPKDYDGYHVDQKSNNPYSLVKAIPEEIRNGMIKDGSVSFTFHDYCKVRYNKTENKFYSLVGLDLTNMNRIIIKYSAKVDFYNNISEEQAEIEEKSSEKLFGEDIPNKLSSYSIDLENTNIGAFIDELRLDPNVRQANYSPPASSS